MKLIAAVNESWGIGKGNDLLYHLPTDMKFFRETTKGNVIIIGRKTLESFPGGNPLKNRTNIVLTRNPSYTKEGITVCSDISKLLDELSKYDSDSVYVCGGEEIYKLLLPYCNEAYITKVADNCSAEKFFPDLDKNSDWQLVSQSENITENGYTFTFCKYKKI